MNTFAETDALLKSAIIVNESGGIIPTIFIRFVLYYQFLEMLAPNVDTFDRLIFPKALTVT